jgi:hypothetical protein
MYSAAEPNKRPKIRFPSEEVWEIISAMAASTWTAARDVEVLCGAGMVLCSVAVRPVVTAEGGTVNAEALKAIKATRATNKRTLRIIVLGYRYGRIEYCFVDWR